MKYNIKGQKTRSKKGRKEQQREKKINNKHNKREQSKVKEGKIRRNYLHKMLNKTTPSFFQNTMLTLGMILLRSLIH